MGQNSPHACGTCFSVNNKSATHIRTSKDRRGQMVCAALKCLLTLLCPMKHSSFFQGIKKLCYPRKVWDIAMVPSRETQKPLDFRKVSWHRIVTKCFYLCWICPHTLFAHYMAKEFKLRAAEVAFHDFIEGLLAGDNQTLSGCNKSVCGCL